MLFLFAMSCDLCELVCEECSQFVSFPLFVPESGGQEVGFSHFGGHGEAKIRVGWSLKALSALEVVCPTSTHPIWEGFGDRLARFWKGLCSL